MRIAVVQHRLRDAVSLDVAALLDATRSAGARGVELLVMPDFCATGRGDLAKQVMHELGDEHPAIIWTDATTSGPTGVAVLESGDPVSGLGTGVVLVGDACISSDGWARAISAGSAYAVMCPRSESDLQAEAALELAIQLSDALCGLVIVAECSGGAPGECGHGGSAIVQLGEVLAEAIVDDDVLVADVVVPIPQPEPREPLPEVPTILQQRIAHHAGRRLDMGYPADLTDGRGPR